MEILTLFIIAGLGYLLGSIPMGVIMAHIFKLGDLRKMGSGNIGATNVLRSGNKFAAFLTLLLDALKGVAAVIIAFQFLPAPCELILCKAGMDCPCVTADVGRALLLFGGGAAIIGHCFPIWLKFKGGKGVATTIGVLLAAVPWTGLAVCVSWALSAAFSKISSLAALSAMIVAPAVTYTLHGLYPALANFAISILVIGMHHQNIRRLRNGSEPKIGAEK